MPRFTVICKGRADRADKLGYQSGSGDLVVLSSLLSLLLNKMLLSQSGRWCLSHRFFWHLLLIPGWWLPFGPYKIFLLEWKSPSNHHSLRSCDILRFIWDLNAAAHYNYGMFVTLALWEVTAHRNWPGSKGNSGWSSQSSSRRPPWIDSLTVSALTSS